MNLFSTITIKIISRREHQLAVLGLWKANFSCPLNRNPADERKNQLALYYNIQQLSPATSHIFYIPIIFFFLFLWTQFFMSCKCWRGREWGEEKNTTRDAKSSLITMLLSWCKTWANSSENFSFFFKGKLWKMLRGNWEKAHSTSADVGSETRCESFIQSLAYIHGIFCYSE